MSCSSGGCLIPEIGVGCQGGWNIAADGNQNWWTTKMSFLPPTTIISPIEQITLSTIETTSPLNRNYISDYNTWSKFLQEYMYCKNCFNKIVKVMQTITTLWFRNLLFLKKTKAVHQTWMQSISRPGCFDFPISTMKQLLIVFSA
jgi:hypothetical protein